MKGATLTDKDRKESAKFIADFLTLNYSDRFDKNEWLDNLMYFSYQWNENPRQTGMRELEGDVYHMVHVNEFRDELVRFGMSTEKRAKFAVGGEDNMGSESVFDLLHYLFELTARFDVRKAQVVRSSNGNTVLSVIKRIVSSLMRSTVFKNMPITQEVVRLQSVGWSNKGGVNFHYQRLKLFGGGKGRSRSRSRSKSKSKSRSKKTTAKRSRSRNRSRSRSRGKTTKKVKGKRVRK